MLTVSYCNNNSTVLYTAYYSTALPLQNGSLAHRLLLQKLRFSRRHGATVPAVLCVFACQKGRCHSRRSIRLISNIMEKPG